MGSRSIMAPAVFIFILFLCIMDKKVGIHLNKIHTMYLSIAKLVIDLFSTEKEKDILQ